MFVCVSTGTVNQTERTRAKYCVTSCGRCEVRERIERLRLPPRGLNPHGWDCNIPVVLFPCGTWLKLIDGFGVVGTSGGTEHLTPPSTIGSSPLGYASRLSQPPPSLLRGYP